MSLDLLNAIGWGVEKITLNSGDGAGQPQVTAASAVNANTIRITFSREMLMQLFTGEGAESTLHPSSYTVSKQPGGTEFLTVLRVTQYSSTQVELLVEDMDSATYEVTVLTAADAWGNDIDSGNNTYSFAATAHVFPTVTRLRTFYGLYGGMQEEDTTDFSPDTDAPYLDNLSPSSSQTGVPVGSNVLLDIKDDDAGVDYDSVVITVGGVIAWENDAPKTANGFTGSRVGDSYTINPDALFDSYVWVTVGVSADDLASLPNSLSTSYQFRTADVAAPYLANQDPNPSDTDVSRSTNIQLDVLDAGAGVDDATVKITVNGSVAWESDTEQAGFTVTKSAAPSGDGYRYLINPTSDLPNYTSIPVRVEADDLVTPTPNSLDSTYNFTTADTIAPTIQNLDPFNGETNVDVWTDVELDIVDDGSGVDFDTVVITIDSVIAWENDAPKTANGFTGSRVGNSYTIIPGTPFSTGTTSTVEVDADDVKGNPLSTSYSFDLELGQAPVFRNLDPVESAADVDAGDPIIFSITDANDDINPTTVSITVNFVTAYANETQQNSYAVVRQAIAGGYKYTVTPPVAFPFGSVVSVVLYVEDYGANKVTKSYTYTVEPDADCFDGPLNTFELSLLGSLGTGFEYTDALRQALIESISSDLDPIEAIRTMFLAAHNSEISPILRDLLPLPTSREVVARLCYKRTALETVQLLPRRDFLIQSSLAELGASGLPHEHVALLKRYAATQEPSTLLSLCCFNVLLARAIIDNVPS
jgi:hypothetical protein